MVELACLVILLVHCVQVPANLKVCFLPRQWTLSTWKWQLVEEGVKD